MWPPDLENQQAILQSRLQTWRLEIPNVVSQLVVPDEAVRDKLRLKLEAQYHAAMMLLFQPSQALRRPNAKSCSICFESAVKRLMIYSRLYENEQLFCGWRSMQEIFHAGVTFLYLIYGLPSIRRSVSLLEVSKQMRLCSNLLSTGGEWWPSLKKAKKKLERVADLVMDKLNSVDAAFGTNEFGDKIVEPLSPTRLASSLGATTRLPNWESDGLLEPSSSRRAASMFTFPIVSPRRVGTECEGADEVPRQSEVFPSPDATTWGIPISNGGDIFDDTLWEFVHLS